MDDTESDKPSSSAAEQANVISSSLPSRGGHQGRELLILVPLLGFFPSLFLPFTYIFSIFPPFVAVLQFLFPFFDCLNLT